MCLGGGSTNYPDLGPRDTSNELIVSKYELSEENKAKNLKRAKSLVKFDNNDDGDGNQSPPDNVYDGIFGDFMGDLMSGDLFGGSGPADNKGGGKSSTGQGFGSSKGM